MGSGRVVQWRVRVAVLSAFASGVSVLGVGGVAAHSPPSWGSTVCGGTPRSCVSHAYNADHRFRIIGDNGMITDFNLHAQAILSSVYDPTDLSAYLSSAANPDVVITVGNFGANATQQPAWVDCSVNSQEFNGPRSSSNYNVSCIGQAVYFNTYYSSYFSTFDQRQFAICHEFGHTVGIGHHDSSEGISDWKNSCVRRRTDSSDSYPDVIIPHDQSHINARF